MNDKWFDLMLQIKSDYLCTLERKKYPAGKYVQIFFADDVMVESRLSMI